MLRYLIGVLLLILLGACTRGFKPPPNEFEIWEKRGALLLEVKKALLECGYRNPTGGGYGWDRDVTILAQKCMLADGFILKSRFKVCSGWITKDGIKHENTSPACQPDAVIPTRSVERRLNSYYCTNYGKKTPECLAPGQEYIPQQNKQPANKNQDDTYQPMREYPDKTMQLQQDMQEQNIRDMNNLLRETNIKGRKPLF